MCQKIKILFKKINTPITWAILFFSFAEWISASFKWESVAKDYLPAMATFVAAYAGAAYTSRFERKKSAEDEITANVAAANIALFTLWAYTNSAFNVKDQIVDPHRHSPGAMIEMQPTFMKESQFVPIKFKSLAFLVKHKQADLLGELSLAESRYLSMMDILKRRSDMHVNILQPKMEAAKVGTTVDEHQVRSILGPSHFAMLEELTKGLIHETDKAILLLDKAAGNLVDVMKTHYPGNIFMRGVVDPDFNPAAKMPAQVSA